MIRRWTEGDTAAVAEIERVSFTDPWSEKMLSDALNNPAFTGLVYEQNAEVIGYVGVLCCEDAELALIAVKPSERGKGVGRALLVAAMDTAERLGADNTFLEVRPSNIAARALYESLGFSQIAVRKKYYSDGEDALIMVKTKSYK